MNERSFLKKTFLSLMEDSDTDVSAKDFVYEDMTRKLCNIRIQDVISKAMLCVKEMAGFYFWTQFTLHSINNTYQFAITY